MTTRVHEVGDHYYGYPHPHLPTARTVDVDVGCGHVGLEIVVRSDQSLQTIRISRDCWIFVALQQVGFEEKVTDFLGLFPVLVYSAFDDLETSR